MGDVLLRERVTVLARTLDAVERVIDDLERSQLGTAAESPSPQVATLAQMTKTFETLQAIRPQQFGRGDQLKYELAMAGLMADLAELGRLMQAPKVTSRVQVRYKQLVESLNDAVTARRTQVQALRRQLDAAGGLSAEARAAAWESYRIAEADCRRLFADYLDLVRGVALRDSGLDDGLCRIADRLVRQLGPIGAFTWDSLTLPASRERRDGPAAIVRIGFPEWSVWTLPLTAVEFASYLINQHSKFGAVRDQAASDLAKLVGKRNRPLPMQEVAVMAGCRELPEDQEARAGVIRTAVGRIADMLVVEVLGTTLMGPAYTWSTLLMRVDPQAGQAVIERLRRDVVNTALERLKVWAHESAQPEVLVSEWDALLVTAGIPTGEELHPDLTKVVDLVVDRVLALVTFRLHEGDWALIDRLADSIVGSLAGPRVGSESAEEVLSDITESHGRPTLRHVLNAGWVARLAHPEVDRAGSEEGKGQPPLSQAIHDLCMTVLAVEERAGQSTETAGVAGFAVGPAPGRNPSLSELRR